MKILRRTLTEPEVHLFNTNPRGTGHNRTMAFICDVAIMIILFMALNTGGAIVWPFYLIYGLQIVILLAMAISFHGQAVEQRKIPDDIVPILTSYSNPALDWPFGPLSIISTLKNIVILGLSAPILMMGYPVMAAMVLVGAVLNQVVVYFRAHATLKAIDALIRHNGLD